MAAVALGIHSDVVSITVGNLNNNEKIMMMFGKFTFNFAHCVFCPFFLEAGGTTPVQKSHYT